MLDMVHSMMSRASLPIHLWGYALETTTHIVNLVLKKMVTKTPHEMWTKKILLLVHIKVWGCEALVRQETHNKLEPKVDKCYFIGYP